MDQALSLNLKVTEPKEIKSSFLRILSDIGTKDTGPAQPILSSYPKAILDNKTKHRKCKSFQTGWYDIYPWISYSIYTNRIYFFPCVYFSPYKQETTFTKKGFGNWEKPI